MSKDQKEPTLNSWTTNIFGKTWSTNISYQDTEQIFVKKPQNDSNKKTIRFITKTDDKDQNEIESYIELKNGAYTKWFIHSNTAKIGLVEGKGYLEKKDNLLSKPIKIELIKSQLEEIRKNVIHRYRAGDDCVVYIKTRGKTKEVQERDYTSTDLPTLTSKGDNPNQVNVLNQLYSQVNNNYRHLADIRFRLLGFVPAISIIAWGTIISTLAGDNEHIGYPIAGILIAILALQILKGIRIYDERNDGLYNDLISRGRKIEEEFGVQTGMFKGRVRGSDKINHGIGISLIYTSVGYGWKAILFYFCIRTIYLLEIHLPC